MVLPLVYAIVGNERKRSQVGGRDIGNVHDDLSTFQVMLTGRDGHSHRLMSRHAAAQVMDCKCIGNNPTITRHNLQVCHSTN